jgi:hypothetical protein
MKWYFLPVRSSGYANVLWFLDHMHVKMHRLVLRRWPVFSNVPLTPHQQINEINDTCIFLIA